METELVIIKPEPGIGDPNTDTIEDASGPVLPKSVASTTTVL